MQNKPFWFYNIFKYIFGVYLCIQIEVGIANIFPFENDFHYT